MLAQQPLETSNIDKQHHVSYTLVQRKPKWSIDNKPLDLPTKITSIKYELEKPASGPSSHKLSWSVIIQQNNIFIQHHNFKITHNTGKPEKEYVTVAPFSNLPQFWSMNYHCVIAFHTRHKFKQDMVLIPHGRLY